MPEQRAAGLSRGPIPGRLWSVPVAVAPVTAVAATTLPDGRAVAVSGDHYGSVWLWHLDTGQPIRILLDGPQGPVVSVAVAMMPDKGAVAVAAGKDGTLRLWELATQQRLGEWTIGHAGRVSSVAVTMLADGRVAAVSGGEDRTVRLWDLATGDQIANPVTGHRGGVRSLATALPNGRPVAVACGDDGRLWVWDLADPSPRDVPVGHRGAVASLAVTTAPDGLARVVAGGGDGILRVWDLATGEQFGDPLSGHRGSVLSVATATMPNGRVVAASAGADGTVRLWDLATRQPVGPPMTGHIGPVRSVAFTAMLDGTVMAVTGGHDGTVRLWDPTACRPSGEPMIGPTNQATSLATATSPDGRAWAVTQSDVGAIRVWDVATGRTVGKPVSPHDLVTSLTATTTPDGQIRMVTGDVSGRVVVWELETGLRLTESVGGHIDWIRSIATATRSSGHPMVVSGADDGTVRAWDLVTGQPIGEPMTGHAGRVWSVAAAALPDGRVIAVSSAEDGVRVWNATTGQTIHFTFESPPSLAPSVAVATLPDGRTMVVSGRTDGIVKAWDALTGQPIGTPMTGHDGAVLSVAIATLADGRAIVIGGGADGTIRVWDLEGDPMIAIPGHHGGVLCCVVVDRPAGGPALLTSGRDRFLSLWSLPELLEVQATGVEETFAGENTGTPDRLSRAGLAQHLAERLRQLTAGDRSPAASAPDPTGSGIVHLDGRWGAGKTTLVELMLREHGDSLGRPIVVRYDAWRQAAIAPEWWSIAAQVRLAVHRSRAFPARVAMSLAEFGRRLGRSTSTWVALIIVAAAGIGGRWLLSKPGGLPAQFSAVLGLVTSISGLLAFAFVVARGLFWSAPALGRLHLRTDDNPLGEISGIVGHLRRWAPREGVPQRPLDLLFTVWIAASSALALWWRPAIVLWRNTSADARSVTARALVVLAILALCGVALRWLRRLRDEPAATGNTPPPSRKASPAPDVKPPRWRTGAIALTVVVAAAAVWWFGRPMWTRGWAGFTRLNPTSRWWLAVAALGAATYVACLAATAGRRRRMILLIIDDLDRCAGDRVVRLLETVHTLLRERCAPRRMRRWRAPAPFGVVVLANGAWVRTAFAKHYEAFNRTTGNESVHDLGADFLQKVFDHSILLPGLSPQQTEDLIHVIAGSHYRSAQPRPHRQPGMARTEPPAPDQLSRPGNSRAAADAADQPPAVAPMPSPAQPAPHEQVSTAPTEAAAGSSAAALPAEAPPSEAGELRRRVAERATADAQAARFDLGVNTQLMVTHLLTTFSGILPGNPRLIIRVTSAWAMLRAVARSLNLEADAEPANELLVRAAVMWVRFPVLVDELLDADQPPCTVPADDACLAQWRRNDVQAVLTMNDGRRLAVEDLALYYGKFFPAR